MRTLLACTAAALLVSWSVGQPPGSGQTGQADPKKPATTQGIDGSWTVVTAEKNGQPMPDAQNMTVTIRDNTITCAGKDGRTTMTMKVDFQGPGMARVTEVAAGSDKPADRGTSDKPADRAAAGKRAVYVLTSEMLAVCVHDDQSKTGTGTGGAERDRSGTAGQPGSSTLVAALPSSHSYCTLILKRATR